MYRHTYWHHSFLHQDFFSCILQKWGKRKAPLVVSGGRKRGQVSGRQDVQTRGAGVLSFLPWPPCELKSDFNDLHRMYFLTSSSDRFGFTSFGVSGCARGGCVCFLCCRWTRPGPSRSLSFGGTLVFSRVLHMSAKRLVQDFCKVRRHSRSFSLWIPMGTVLLVIHFDLGAIQYRCFRLC